MTVRRKPGLATGIRWAAPLFGTIVLLLSPLSFAQGSRTSAGIAPRGPCASSNACSVAAIANLSADWINVTPISGPISAGASEMTYDAHAGRLVLYSGSHAGSVTYFYEQGRWRLVVNSGGPSFGPTDVSMAYDAHDGYVVLFGGYFGSTSGDTWIFSHGDWKLWESYHNATSCSTNPPTNTKFGPCPPPQYDTPMTYDAKDGYVLLGSSWAFVNGSWSKLSTTGSPPRLGAMTYDVADGYVLFFGSDGSTWTYSAGTWTALTLTHSPHRRNFAGMTYDAADRQVVMFGGSLGYWTSTITPFYNDTWTYRAGVWTNRTFAVAPSPRAGMALGFDPTQNRTVAFGGWVIGPGGFPPTGGTWRFALRLTAIAFAVPSRQDAGAPVQFEGAWAGAPSATSLAWSFGDGTASTLQNPSHTYVASGNYLVHFWANSTSGASANSSVLVAVFPTLSAPSLTETPNPTDAGQSVEVAVNWTGGVPPFQFHWRYYTYSFTDRHSSFDLYILTRGTYPINVTVFDSTGANVSAFSNLTANSALSLLRISTNRTATDVGYPVGLTSTLGGGTPPYSVNWSFGDNSSNAFGATTSHTYSSTGAFIVRAVANDSAGEVRTARLTEAVNALPSVFPQASTTTVDVGTPVSFTAGASGGSAPFTAVWSFGDGTPLNRSDHPTHAYAAAGNHTVKLWWNDSVGATAFGSVVVDAVSALSVVLNESNTTVSLGQSILLTALVSGGQGGYQYTWTGLPPGCVSVDQPSIGCLPTQAGNYTPTVGVMDSTAANNSSSVMLAVTFNFTASVAPAPVAGKVFLIQVRLVGEPSVSTYSYQGLPPGCNSSNTANLPCTTDAPGAYHLLISLTDRLGFTVRHSLTLSVAGSPGASGAASTGSLNPAMWVAAGLAAGLGAAAFAWVVFAQRRRPPVAPSSRSGVATESSAVTGPPASDGEGPLQPTPES